MLSPFFFETDSPDTFIASVELYKTWYFWAEVFEMGTAVNNTTIGNPDTPVVFFLVEPVIGQGEGGLRAEDFLDIISGHENGGQFYGYSWTIMDMVKEWHTILKHHCNGKPYSVNDYALRIDYDIKEVAVVPKDEAWKLIETVEF